VPMPTGCCATSRRARATDGNGRSIIRAALHGHEWTLYLHSISLLIVFLSLAALYESWSVPDRIRPDRRAAAGGRDRRGLGVAGGMVAATELGIFFVPALLVLVLRIFPGTRIDAARLAVAEPAE